MGEDEAIFEEDLVENDVVEEDVFEETYEDHKEMVEEVEEHEVGLVEEMTKN